MTRNLSYINFIKRFQFKGLEILFVEDAQKYDLYAYEGPLLFCTVVWKDLKIVVGIDPVVESKNLQDFESNYKGSAFDIT